MRRTTPLTAAAALGLALLAPTAPAGADSVEGRDRLAFDLVPGAYVLDNVAGELRRDGTVVEQWSDVGVFVLTQPETGSAPLDIRGNDTPRP